MIEKMVGVIATVAGVLHRPHRNGLSVRVLLIQIAQRLGQQGQRLYAPVSRGMVGT